MNPHFLFNALNAIKNFIIKNDQKQAVVYLTKIDFTDLYDEQQQATGTWVEISNPVARFL